MIKVLNDTAEKGVMVENSEIVNIMQLSRLISESQEL